MLNSKSLSLRSAGSSPAAVLASASMEALTALPKLLEDFPRCRALLRQPLPIRY